MSRCRLAIGFFLLVATVALASPVGAAGPFTYHMPANPLDPQAVTRGGGA